MRALHIVLGTGPLGRATAAALRSHGHDVRMINRSGRADVTDGIAVIAADLYDPQAVAAATRGAAAVYQCAQPAYHQWVTQFAPLQDAIITGVAQHGARLIVAENLYMYGHVSGPIHEGLPYAPTSKKGVVRARMAEQIAEVHRSGKLQTASARGSDFFGPYVHESSLGTRVFGAALRGKPAQALGKLDIPHSHTYIKDFGATLALLGTSDAGLGTHWHVPTLPAITQRQTLERIFQAIGTPTKISRIGRGLLRMVGLFNPGAREMVEMFYEFEQPFVIDSSRFTSTFGLQPTPLETAISETVAWYRSEAQRELTKPTTLPKAGA